MNFTAILKRNNQNYCCPIKENRFFASFRMTMNRARGYSTTTTKERFRNKFGMTGNKFGMTLCVIGNTTEWNEESVK